MTVDDPQIKQELEGAEKVCFGQQLNVQRNLTATVRMRIKKKMQRSFCVALNAKSAEMLLTASQLLREAFHEASKFVTGRDYFVACLRFLIERTCEKSTGRESRLNCLTMVVNGSLALSQREQVDILDVLVGFCQKASQLTVHLRIYACSLAGMLFSRSRKIDEACQIENSDAKSCLPVKYKSCLYSMLIDREFDSSAAVRAEALQALKWLQHENFCSELDLSLNQRPQEILKRHLKDVSSECRLAAAESLSLADKNNIETLVGPTNSNIVAEFLNGWLRRVGMKPVAPSEDSVWKVAAFELLKCVDIFDETEVCRGTMILSLAFCREKLGLGSTEYRFFVKEIVYSGSDWVVNSHNYKQLLNKTLTFSKMAKMVFFLRCMVDFCKMRCQSEGDWSECQYKLLPSMHTYCEFVKKFVTSESILPTNVPRDKHFALIQLLDIIPSFELDDASGRKTWKDLLEFILLSYKINLSFEVIDHVVRMLYEYFWPRMEDNEAALLEICDITSGIVHRDCRPYASVLAANETIAINVLNVTALPEVLEVDVDALLRCIMIINSMMKTNRYKSMNAFLLGLLDNVVERGLISENSECRLLAFEAMGIISLCDKECARQKTVFVKDTLELLEDLKVTALNILCNFSLVYGFDVVSEWFSEGKDFGDLSNNLLQTFCTHVWSKDPVSSYSACKCLCQLLLAENIKKPQEPLCQLLLKAFSFDVENQPALKSCLDCFIDCYSSDRKHQLYLVQCFKDVFNAIIEMPSHCSVSKIDQSKIGLRLASATQLSSLKNGDSETNSANILLCEVILEMLTTDREYENEVLSTILCDLDVNTWKDVAFLYRVEEKLEDTIPDFDENKKIVRALEVFKKKIQSRLHTLEASKRKERRVRKPHADENIDLDDLVRQTGNMTLRTPITRSASKKLQSSEGTSSNQTNEAVESLEEAGDCKEWLPANIQTHNVTARRARRRLNPRFEVSMKLGTPMPLLKELEEDEFSGRKSLEKNDRHEVSETNCQKVADQLAKLNCESENDGQKSLLIVNLREVRTITNDEKAFRGYGEAGKSVLSETEIQSSPTYLVPMSPLKKILNN